MNARITMPSNIQPLLLTAKESAQACGCGLTLWYQLSSKGATPQPIRLNSKLVWARSHLEAWTAAGCPCRTDPKWQALLERIHTFTLSNSGCRCGGQLSTSPSLERHHQ